MGKGGGICHCFHKLLSTEKDVDTNPSLAKVARSCYCDCATDLFLRRFTLVPVMNIPLVEEARYVDSSAWVQVCTSVHPCVEDRGQCPVSFCKHVPLFSFEIRSLIDLF